MTTPQALLITRDDLLLDDVLRLAAATGATLEVAHDVTAALRGWSSASVVLVGSDLAAGVAAQHPPRRDQVHVVAPGPVGDEVFRSALVAGALGVVGLPEGEPWLVELLSDAADAAAGGHGGRARTIGVVGGSGGVGATTFACSLGLVAATGSAALLIDLDPLGPGVDRIVGLDGGPGARWDSLRDTRGRLGSRSLRAALPTRDGLAVLTWSAGPPVALDPVSVREVLSAGRRGNDVVVVDLPRSIDDVSAEVVTRCDRLVVVTEATVAGVAAAGRVTAVLRPLTEQVALAVRAGRGALPSQQVGEALSVPVVVEVPFQRRLGEQVDLGLGPVHSPRSSLARAAGAVLRTVPVGRTLEGVW